MQVSGRRPGAGPVPLSRLQMALADARVVRLRYRALGRDELTWRDVEPLGLVFYLDQWHLIGWCRLRKDVRDFRVDRVAAVEVGQEPTPPRDDFDLANYLAKSWMPEPRETAKIEVHPRLVESVRRYWGPAVLEESPSGKGVRMVFTHAPQETGHVARWVLGLGTLIHVLGPKALRDEVVVQARKALAHHAPGE